MDIIHIVANTDPINMGVWASCLKGEEYLQKKGIYSHFWTCSGLENESNIRFKILDLKETPIPTMMQQLSLHFKKEETILISYGSWLNPTRIGYYAAKLGFNWIYVPQGMLEPWSLEQNKWFKKVYFQLFEKKYIGLSKAIRAVSKPEKSRLEKMFTKPVFYIPNSVPLGQKSIRESDILNFVFMSRLHHKKGIMPFVLAWDRVFKNKPNTRLIIAGPDEGELEKLKPYLNGNIEYIGPVFGEEKTELLKKAHYFLLPSFSEGLPSSVLEAMSFGAIPLISMGCNFEEVFENQLGYQAEPNEKELESLLSQLSVEKYDQQKSDRNVEWINDYFSEDKVAESFIQEYSKVLGHVYKG